MTKVRELMKVLQEFDEDDVVILSSDAEGNRYMPFDDAVYGIYVPSTPWVGEVYDADDQDQIPVGDDKHFACIFYPVS